MASSNQSPRGRTLEAGSASQQYCDAIQNLLEASGNDSCVDCQSTNVAFCSCNLGVFLCQRCATVHARLGGELDNMKALHERFSSELLQKLKSMGNERSKEIYEKNVPACYKMPRSSDADVLLEEWIASKYLRREFVEGAGTPSYLTEQKDGYLWKRGRNGKHFKKRRFILGCVAHRCTLKYYNKETAREPKAEISVDDLTVLLDPERIGHPNGLHIFFSQNDMTRSLYLYAETGQDAVDWFTALRFAKLKRLAIAFPSSSLDDLLTILATGHEKEGWLMKAGPRAGDAYRKRWITLDRRKILYYEDPHSATPNGEILLGGPEQFSVEKDLTDYSVKFGILLKTPNRVYHLYADSAEVQESWIKTLDRVIHTPPAVHDPIVSAANASGGRKKSGIRQSVFNIISR